MLRPPPRRRIDVWPCMIGDLSEDAECERGRKSKIREHSGRRRITRATTFTNTIQLLCYLNRAPYKWSLDFRSTPRQPGSCQPNRLELDPLYMKSTFGVAAFA